MYVEKESIDMEREGMCEGGKKCEKGKSLIEHSNMDSKKKRDVTLFLTYLPIDGTCSSEVLRFHIDLSSLSQLLKDN